MPRNQKTEAETSKNTLTILMIRGLSIDMKTGQGFELFQEREKIKDFQATVLSRV